MLKNIKNIKNKWELYNIYIIFSAVLKKTCMKKSKLLKILIPLDYFEKKKTYNFFILFLQNSNPNPELNIMKLLQEYFHIWPLFQWTTSLLTLIVVYWMSGYFYNKYLSEKGGWMNAKTRVIMIFVDLMLNFILGIYYMNYRETVIGALMIQCPVFLSPIFWIVELLCFYIYYRNQFSSENKK